MTESVEHRVGKTAQVVFRLMSVDPVSGGKLPEEGASPVVIVVNRPDGSQLIQKTTGNGGVEDRGNGYYVAPIVPDIHGTHTVKMAADAAGASEREVGRFYVHPF